MFICSLEFSPYDHSKHSTLCPPPARPVHSDTNSTSLGSIQPHCSYYKKTVQSHISATAYTFIQLSELGRRGDNANVQALKLVIQTRDVSIESPEFYCTAINAVTNCILFLVYSRRWCPDVGRGVASDSQAVGLRRHFPTKQLHYSRQSEECLGTATQLG